MTKGYPCPCCGFITRGEEAPGTFEICSICYWEDDYSQYYRPDSVGGANNVSLNQARKNFKEFGAISKEELKFIRQPLEDEIPSTLK